MLRTLFTPDHDRSWKAGTLVGSPAVEMARTFVWAPALSVVVPWKYFFREFVLPARRRGAHDDRARALRQQAAGA